MLQFSCEIRGERVCKISALKTLSADVLTNKQTDGNYKLKVSRCRGNTTAIYLKYDTRGTGTVFATIGEGNLRPLTHP